MKRACRRSQPVRISRSIRAGVLPVPASAKGAGYLSPRVRARMAELQLTQADLAAIAGKRKRRTGHDQRSGKFPRQTRETNRGRRERDPHRRGRCDAAQLDATARHGGRFRLSRSGAGRSGEARSKTGPCALCFARARSCALAETASRGRASDRRSRDSLRVDRHRRRGGSAGRHHGSGHPERRQNFARRPNEPLHRAGRSRPPPPGDFRNDLRRHRFRFEFRHFRPGLGNADSPARSNACFSASAPERKRPLWSEEKKQFVPTTQAELTLSFDHRSLDGGGAGRLLQQRRRAARHAGKL